MKGLGSLVATTLALFLVFSFIGNSSSAPQTRPPLKSPCAAAGRARAEGRRFISDQSRKKDLSDRPSPERRSPNPQLLTLPETAALLLASLQRPQEAGEENFDQTRILEDY
ncbi:spexin [Herpailurus yagouaroundi]|uniref:spexin n=1 Tax=Herpailurus yagouaroundi TaxID=1608482 RepID=UPI001AD608F8|nr:spexin [Puma yagouaroundi]